MGASHVARGDCRRAGTAAHQPAPYSRRGGSASGRFVAFASGHRRRRRRRQGRRGVVRLVGARLLLAPRGLLRRRAPHLVSSLARLNDRLHAACASQRTGQRRSVDRRATQRAARAAAAPRLLRPVEALRVSIDKQALPGVQFIVCRDIEHPHELFARLSNVRSRTKRMRRGGEVMV